MSVVQIVADAIPTDTEIETPSHHAKFKVRHYGISYVALEIGKGRAIKIPIRCFEGSLDYLRGKGWIKIGAHHGSSNEQTFDSYVKNFTSGISAASYVAPMLEKAGIVEIEKGPPARIRLMEK